MIEFSSETGGRFTYVDDVLNLQELALAFSAIFDDCDNFIVSGCEVIDDTIAPGIVYLNGKLRVFNGASEIQTWPQYIYESNTTEDVTYQSGGKKLGRKIWGCTLGADIPASSSQTIPQSIEITSTGGLRMKDAWLGKYVVLLTPMNQVQTMTGTLAVDKLNAKQIDTETQMTIKTDNGSSLLRYDDGEFVIESATGGYNKYRLAFSSNGITLYKNTIAIARFTDNAVVFNSPISSSQAGIGAINIAGSHIYNTSNNADDGELSINMVGYNGTTTNSRNTFIGDGKGNKIVSVLGNKGEVDVNGRLAIDSETGVFLSLRSTKTKSDNTLKAIVSWFDSTPETIAMMGFTESSSQLFTLSNYLGEVKISGVNYVDIAPLIKEGGTLLSDKYVLNNTFTTELAKKIDSSSVYSRTETDARYATLSGGLSQFINAAKNKETLCGEIGALTKSSLSAYPTLENCLSDMATSEILKKQIRDNIGAVGVDECQVKLTDTGWVKIVDNLYARQIGDIVSVQGTMTAHISGVAFTLPNNICAPRYTVNCDSFGATGYYWSGRIEGGQKSCSVIRSSTISGSIPISFTYMI